MVSFRTVAVLAWHGRGDGIRVPGAVAAVVTAGLGPDGRGAARAARQGRAGHARGARLAAQRLQCPVPQRPRPGLFRRLAAFQAPLQGASTIARVSLYLLHVFLPVCRYFWGFNLVFIISYLVFFPDDQVLPKIQLLDDNLLRVAHIIDGSM